MILQQHSNNTNNNKNNNKKNDINNNKIFSYPIPNNKPLRIVTHNVQGITCPTKQQQIIDTLDLERIDILGLSETKLSPSTSKYAFKRNINFKYFFNNDSTSYTGSGVGLIISNAYAKYI